MVYDYVQTLRKVGFALAAFGVPAILANWNAIDSVTLPMAVGAVILALRDWYVHYYLP